MYIHELPVELQERILDNIEPWELRRGVACACRLWARAARRRAPAVRSVRELRALHAGVRALFVPAGLDGFNPLVLLTRAVHLAPRAVVALTLHAGVLVAQADYAVIHDFLPHLRHLDVFSDPASGTSPVPSILPRLRSVVFNDEYIYPRLETEFSRYRLRALHMYGKSRIFESPLSALQASRDHLTELTLRCTEMRDRTFKAVGECANLETLRLYSCWLMRGAGAVAVTRPARLRRLHVTGAVLVRRADLAAMLAASPLGLEELVLSGDRFADEHVAVLTARVPNLAVLEAWDCPLTATGALRLAAALRRLRVLDLNRALPARHIAALTRHPAIEFLRLLPENLSNELNTHQELEESTETKETLNINGRGDTISTDENLSNYTLESSAKDEEKSDSNRLNVRLNIKDEDEAIASLSGPPRAVRVESAAAAFAGEYFTDSGAGFRGKLFYSWTPALQLRPKGEPPKDGDFDF